MSASLRHQRGVALLVALLVVALAVILIAALLDRGELALARTRNALRTEQAEAYAQGLEAYAAQALVALDGLGGADTHASPWASPLPPQPVPGGSIAATMRDMNGCFNLNNLAGPNSAAWRPVFGNLLAALGLPRELAAPVEDWLGHASGGSDANYYLALPVAYRARGGPFAHVSELRLVRGISGDVYARLAPHVCALPPGTTINVNTADVAVLRSLGDHLGEADAERLWNHGQANHVDVAAFFAAAADPSLDARAALLDVHSNYFLARGDIVLDSVPFTFYSLIERGSNGIRVLERSRGSDDALVAAAPVTADGADGASPR
jgi:general secretion pathway protein K